MNLIQEMKKLDVMIVAIKEVRWWGNKIRNYDVYSVFYSGTKEKKLFGTGVLVCGKLKNHILNFEPVCTWTEEKEEAIKSSFQKMQKHDIKTVVGNMNAKIQW
jgi:hypothetical protein